MSSLKDQIITVERRIEQLKLQVQQPSAVSPLGLPSKCTAQGKVRSSRRGTLILRCLPNMTEDTALLRHTLSKRTPSLNDAWPNPCV